MPASESPPPPGADPRTSAQATFAESPQSASFVERPLAPNLQIDRFVILKPVGAGGMGVVYAGYDAELDRKVAIKLLRADLGDHALGSARMLREAQAMARLSHPNVVQIYQAGEFGGRVFIAMEFVAGLNAREWLVQAPRSWQQVLDVYMQAGRGLVAAHDAGLIHRDFKPDNVLIGADGRVRVADFGLARVQVEPLPVADDPAVEVTASADDLQDARLTATRTLVGTPAYMAPEQHVLDPVDPRTDQYSFCAALYEALYGVLPFSGRDRQEIHAAMMRGKLEQPKRRGVIPQKVHAALVRGLAVDPRQRWPDMRALLVALDPHSGRARLVGAGFAALLSAGTVAARLYGGEAPVVNTCGGGAAHLAPVWGPERRAGVHTAVAATALPLAEHTADRVVAVLDAYAGGWSRMYTDACQAHQDGEQSSDLLDRRMTCLARRLADLEAVTQVLEAADSDVAERAVQAASALPPLSACADSEALLAQLEPPGALAGPVAALRDRLSQVEANLRAGRVEAAHALVEPAVAEARALGYEPALAEALLVRGKVEGGLRRTTDARATHDEAYALALAVGHDVVAAELATAQLHRTGYELARQEVADEWTRQAEALLRRASAGPERWIDFHRALGSLHLSRGELERAFVRYQQALALAEQQPAFDRVALARLLHDSANISLELRSYPLAVQQYEQAMARFTAELGPDHPQLVVFKTNLGRALSRAGRLDEAERAFTDALALCERVRGPRHVDCAKTLWQLGLRLGEQGRHADARTYLRRAADSYEAALGPEARDLGHLSIDLGAALRRLGDLAGARAHLERAQKIHRRWYGETYGSLPYELTEIGNIALAAGDPAAARPPLEQALAYRQRYPVARDELAETQFALARALWPAPDQRTRARELARQAELGLRDAPAKALLHAEVVAWNERHAP